MCTDCFEYFFLESFKIVVTGSNILNGIVI